MLTTTSSTSQSLPQAARETRATQRQQWRYKNRHAIFAWVVLIPVLLYFFIFNILPVLLNLVVSFTNWNAITQPDWVGVENYLRFLSPPYPTIILNTIIFSVAILLLQTIAALGVALLLNQKVYGRGVFRAMWYIPTLTSGAIMAQITLIFISPYGGVLNNILMSIGQKPVIWTLDPIAMRLVIIVFSVWRGLGGPIILFLAALQGIHKELYEAAQVDGASRQHLLRFITLPLIQPMIVFVLVTTFIANFQILEPILLISKGGPNNQTNVMLYQIYRDAFTNQDFGMASTGGMVMSIILFGFSIYVVRALSREQREEEQS